MSGNRTSRRFQRRDFLRAALGTAGLFAVPWAPPAQAADARTIDDVLGKFEHAGGEAERQAVLAAIEDVIRDMSPIVRPVARARLVEANPVPPRLALSADGKRVTLAYAEETYAAPLDGSPVHVVTRAGDEMKLRALFRNGTLQQVFAGDEKSRTNIFRREGEQLAIYVTVRASALPKELAYRLTYARIN